MYLLYVYKKINLLQIFAEKYFFLKVNNERLKKFLYFIPKYDKIKLHIFKLKKAHKKYLLQLLLLENNYSNK